MRSASRTQTAKTMVRPRKGTKRLEFEREALVHLDALYAYALRLAGGDEAVAEDLVQEAVLNAYRGWHRYELGTNCRAWLMTILRNAFFSWQRKQGRLPTTHAESFEEPGRAVPRALRTIDPEDDFFSRIMDSRLIEAIDALPLHYREAVVLSDLQGLAYGDIAEILGVAVGTVKSRLFRGRRALQSALVELAVELGYQSAAA